MNPPMLRIAGTDLAKTRSTNLDEKLMLCGLQLMKKNWEQKIDCCDRANQNPKS